MPKIREEWYIIVNPRAGSGKTMSLWVPAESLLTELSIPFHTVYTTHKHHAEELAATAARLGYRRILAVGGDGSVHEMLNGVLKWCFESGTPTEDFYLGVMPIGSGNDWIKGLGVPNDVEDVARLIAKGSFGQQDVYRFRAAEGEVCYMANCGGVGFDSHVCERVNLQKERGMRNSLLYVRALRYVMATLRAMNCQVICDGKEVYTGKCYSVALGGGKYSGGGLCQAPLAKADDGLLDVMIVPKFPMGKMIKELPRLLNGSIHKSDKIIYRQCRKFSIMALDSLSNDIFEVDGE